MIPSLCNQRVNIIIHTFIKFSDTDIFLYRGTKSLPISKAFCTGKLKLMLKTHEEQCGVMLLMKPRGPKWLFTISELSRQIIHSFFIIFPLKIDNLLNFQDCYVRLSWKFDYVTWIFSRAQCDHSALVVFGHAQNKGLPQVWKFKQKSILQKR